MSRKAHVRFGLAFLGLAVIQLVPIAISGDHLLNLLVDVGWLILAAAHFGMAIRCARRDKAKQSAGGDAEFGGAPSN